MRCRRAWVWAVLVVLAATGCTTQDPLQGLSATQGATAPLDARVPPPAGPVALVPSQHVEAFLTSNRGEDAEFMVAAAMTIFRALYPGVAFLPNLVEARSRGMDRTIVLDVQGGPSRATIQAVVLDRAMRPVSRIEAQGSDTEGNAARTYDRALVQLQQRTREVFP